MLIFFMLFIAGTINCAEDNYSINKRTHIYASYIKNGTPFPESSLWSEQVLKPISYIAVLQKEQGDDLITKEAKKLVTHEMNQYFLNPSLQYKLDTFPSNRNSYTIKNPITKTTYLHLTDNMTFSTKPRPLCNMHQQTINTEENNMPEEYKKIPGIRFHCKSQTGNTYAFAGNDGYFIAQKDIKGTLQHLRTIKKMHWGIYDLTDFHCIFKSDHYEYTIQNISTGQKYLFDNSMHCRINTDEKEGKYACLEYKHPSILYATYVIANLITGTNISFLHKCPDENANFRTTFLKNNILNIIYHTENRNDMTVCRYDLPACITNQYPVPEGSILYSEQQQKTPPIQSIINSAPTIDSLHDMFSDICDRKSAHKIYELANIIKNNQHFFNTNNGTPFTIYQALVENNEWLYDNTIGAFLIKQIVTNINQSLMSEEQYHNLKELYTTYINQLFPHQAIMKKQF